MADPAATDQSEAMVDHSRSEPVLQTGGRGARTEHNDSASESGHHASRDRRRGAGSSNGLSSAPLCSSEPSLRSAAAVSASSSVPAHNNSKKKERSGFFGRIRRGALMAIGTSSLGKSQVLKALPLETQDLVEAMLSLVEATSPKKDASKDLRQTILRLLVMLGVEHDARKISYKELIVADKPLRAAFELISKLFDYYDDDRQRVNLSPHFAKVERYFVEVEEILSNKLRAHLSWTEEDFGMLKDILQQVGSAAFLEKCWATKGLENHLFDMCYAMDRYTTFHYYSKSTGEMIG